MVNRLARKVAATRSNVDVTPKSVPQYTTLTEFLRRNILSGVYPLGHTFDNEHSFSEQLGVSRITLRRALSAIERDGLIERRPRLGTTVISSTPKRFWKLNSISDILHFGTSTRLDIKRFRMVNSYPVEARTFDVAVDLPHYRLDAERFRDNKLIGFSYFFFPKQIGSLLTKRDFKEVSVIPLLEQKAGIRVGRATEVISSHIASPAIATRLGTEAGTAVLIVVRHYYDDGGNLIEAALTWYLGSEFQIRREIEP